VRTQLPFAVLAAALACSLFTVSAYARARTFVASYGNDSNPCTFGSPCKTFQQAVNVVDPGGEVTAIDSAGFGPILITKAVSITSPNGVEAGIVPVSGGNSITINAGPFDATSKRRNANLQHAMPALPRAHLPEPRGLRSRRQDVVDDGGDLGRALRALDAPAVGVPVNGGAGLWLLAHPFTMGECWLPRAAFLSVEPSRVLRNNDDGAQKQQHMDHP